MKKLYMIPGLFLALLASPASAGDCNLTANGVVTQPDCGVNNGEIDVTVLTGTFPFYYFWADGPTTEDRTGLAPGLYELTIWDALNCGLKLQFDLRCEEEESCEFRSQTMGGWGAPPNGNNPAMYLQNNFALCFPNGVTIGCATGHTLTLTTSTAVKNFLPATGPAGQLTGDLVNPLSSPAKVLGGQLTAAVVNVTVDACDPNFSPSGGWLGDVVYVGGPFAGMTLSAVIDEANSFVGGCGGSHTASEYTDALDQANRNYDNGTVDLGYFECKKEEDRSMTIPAGLEIYPNPAADQLFVTMNVTAANSMTMQVVDVTGRVVMEPGTMSLTAGANQISIDLSRMQEGTYMLVSTMGGQQSVKRFVVKR